MSEGPTARVEGLMPPGRDGIRTVELHPNQIWTVGRRDSGFLAARPDRARWHLALPDAGPDLSVNQMELRVGNVGVSVSSRGGSGVTVDGVVRPSPCVLTSGTSMIAPTTAATHAGFTVTVLRSEDFAEPNGAMVASGTTMALHVELEQGTALAKVAHALAWPCMPTRRRPHVTGWSGRDVVERLAQLGWAVTEPGNERTAITVIGKQLIVLADKVAEARLTGGRRADAVLALWPPWRDAGEGETRDQRAERRNRCVADVLWRAGVVVAGQIDR